MKSKKQKEIKAVDVRNWLESYKSLTGGMPLIIPPYLREKLKELGCWDEVKDSCVVSEFVPSIPSSERTVDNSFGCLCPEGKKNGDNGIFHLTPIDCSPEEK